MILRLTAISAFVFLTNLVFAGKIDRAYEAFRVFDYFKAKKMFSKAMKYNPSPAAQGLAIIYSRNDNPFYNLDSAYHYVLKSIDGYDLTKEGKRKKYAVYGFDQDSLIRLRNQISTKIFRVKHKENSIEAYQSFIDLNPWAAEVPQAVASRDSIAFFNAVHENSSRAFNEFVTTYPQSDYLDLAQESYHHLKFIEETGDGSMESFESFVANNPRSPLVSDAQEQVYRMRTEKGDIDGYEQFIFKHKDYPQIELAWEELFQRFLVPYSEERINAFNEKYPDHPINDRVALERLRMRDDFLPLKRGEEFYFLSFDGDTLLSLTAEAVGDFNEGLCSFAKNGKVGIIDVSGEERVKAMYESISPFVNGQAIVELEGKYGVIDRNGRTVMDLVFDDIGDLIGGRRFAQFDELYGYYDENGFNIIQHGFTDAYDFENGMAKVLFQEKPAYIDLNGTYIIQPYFDDIKPFNDSLFVYEENGLFGLTDKTCKKITEPQYNYIGVSINGLAVASHEDRVVYINGEGKIVIDKSFEVFPNYIQQGTFKDSIAVVYQEGKYGRIQPDGMLLNKFKYDNIGNGKGVFTGMKEEFWGLFGKNDKTILSAEYDELFFVNDELLIARRNDTTGMILKTGKAVIPFLFADIEKLTDSLYLVKQNGLSGVYKRGEMLFPVEYDEVTFFSRDVIRLINDRGLVYLSIIDGRVLKIEQDVRLD